MFFLVVFAFVSRHRTSTEMHAQETRRALAQQGIRRISRPRTALGARGDTKTESLIQVRTRSVDCADQIAGASISCARLRPTLPRGKQKLACASGPDGSCTQDVTVQSTLFLPKGKAPIVIFGKPPAPTPAREIEDEYRAQRLSHAPMQHNATPPCNQGPALSTNRRGGDGSSRATELH